MKREMAQDLRRKAHGGGIRVSVSRIAISIHYEFCAFRLSSLLGLWPAIRLISYRPAVSPSGLPGRLIFLAVVLLLAGCASLPVVSVETLPAFDAAFERQTGWTGADGAYSVAMAADEILWLFGDTWYGEVRQNRHVNAAIVNNSVAIQRGTFLPEASLRFYPGRTPDGRPQAFLRPADGRGWIWPYDGVRIGPALYLFTVQVERTENRNSFGFTIVDSWLATVANPAESPREWRLSQQRIVHGRFSPDGDTLFGSALLNINQFVYIYGTTEDVRGTSRRKFMILARAPETQLAQFDRWRFFANGKWTADFRQASRLCRDVANEYSVSFMASIGRYVLVYTESGFSENIAVRFAPNPWGPWSEPKHVYACPEAARSEDTFCYAAKGHPDLSAAPDEIIVSYITNSLDFEKITTDAALYRPRFIRLRFQSN